MHGQLPQADPQSDLVEREAPVPGEAVDIGRHEQKARPWTAVGSAAGGAHRGACEVPTAEPSFMAESIGPIVAMTLLRRSSPSPNSATEPAAHEVAERGSCRSRGFRSSLVNPFGLRRSKVRAVPGLACPEEACFCGGLRRAWLAGVMAPRAGIASLDRVPCPLTRAHGEDLDRLAVRRDREPGTSTTRVARRYARALPAGCARPARRSARWSRRPRRSARSSGPSRGGARRRCRLSPSSGRGRREAARRNSLGPKARTAHSRIVFRPRARSGRRARAAWR